MKIYPPALEIGDKEGFTPEKDIFGQAELGKGMTNLVSTISDPLVIAFNGKWGTGKTTFLKMWAGELRNSGFPVICFDAFENDYVDDAFAVLAREIIELAEDEKPENEKIIDNLKENTIKLGAQLLKGAAKVGTKVVIRAATAGLLKESDLKEAIQENADEAAEEYMSDFLTKPKEQKDIVANFRKALEELPALIAPLKENEKQKSLVFIIDELDRCKPLFALQILERIKHFMSVPNVHFVFGVHLGQLERSVQFAYGTDIDDATVYLQKFINLTISNADTAEYDHDKHIVRYVQYLQKTLSLSAHTDTHYIVEFLQRVALKNHYSLRILERVYTNIVLAVAFTSENKNFEPSLIAGLCILKVVEPNLFKKAKLGQLEYSDIEKTFGFSNLPPEDENYKLNSDRDDWEYVLSNPLPDRLKIGSRSDNNRKNKFAYMVNEIVDRLDHV